MTKLWPMVAAMLALSAILPAHAAGDAATGEKLSKVICVACHNFTKDAPKKIGPTLYGVLQRGAGQAPEFKYSKAFQAALGKGLAWNDETLEAYLTAPTAFLHKISGDDASGPSPMVVALNPQQRQDIIAWLHTLGDKP